jgi:hypothetical protein
MQIDEKGVTGGSPRQSRVPQRDQEALCPLASRGRWNGAPERE